GFDSQTALVHLAESHAAVIKQTVIKDENTIGTINKYLQLKTVIAAKQMANAHAVTRICARFSPGSRPSCHANTAANKRNTLTDSPAPRKKSQYVRLLPNASK